MSHHADGRRRWSRRGVLCAVGALSVLGAGSQSGQAQAENRSESWRQSGQDPQRSGFAPENTVPSAPISTSWSAEAVTRGAENQAEPRIDGGRVYTSVDSDENTSLVAAAVETGREVWRRQAPVTGLVVGDQHLHTLERESSEAAAVAARSKNDGSPAWRETFADVDALWQPDALLYHDGRVYLTGQNSTVLLAFDAASGARTTVEPRRREDVDEFAWLGLAAAGSDLYATAATRTLTPDGGRYERLLYRFSGEGLQRRWARTITEQLSSVSSPVVDDGRVYVGVNPGSGSSIGSQDAPPPPLVAFDRETGNRAWTYDDDVVAVTRPALADGRLYVPDFEGRVHAVSATDGTRDWRQQVIPASLNGVVTSVPSVVDGAVHVLFEGDRLLVTARQTEDGSERWTWRGPSNDGTFGISAQTMRDRSIPIAAGRLFAYTNSEGLVVLGPETAGTTPGGETTPDGEPTTRTTPGGETTTQGVPGSDAGTTDAGAAPPADESDGDGLPLVPIAGAGLAAVAGLVGLYYRRGDDDNSDRDGGDEAPPSGAETTAGGGTAAAATTGAAGESAAVWVENTGGEQVRCRIRCRTETDVQFQHDHHLDPGQEARLGAVPDEPFEVAATVKGGGTVKEVFQPEDRTDVCVRVAQGAIDVYREAL